MSYSVRILFQIIMARRRVSDTLRWQIIGMRNPGLNCREIGRQINRHHSVIARLVQKFGVTNDVRDRPQDPAGNSARRPFRCTALTWNRRYNVNAGILRPGEESISLRRAGLLHVVDGRLRVWRCSNMAMAERHIAETIPYGGGSVMLWCLP